MDKQYTYECRPCPPRTRRECIQQSRMSPGVKRMIERAFASHTDTQATWDLLHRNCLLELRDQAVVGRSRRNESGLLARLQKQAEEKANREQAEEPSPPVVKPRRPSEGGLFSSQLVDPGIAQAEPESPPIIKPPTPVGQDWTPNWDAELRAAGIQHVSPRTKKAPRQRDTQVPIVQDYPAQPGSTQDAVQAPHGPPVVEDSDTSVDQFPADAIVIRYPTFIRPKAVLPQTPGPRMLVAEVTGHRILLPEQGNLTLGRFDPHTRVTPDVDLTFEDRWARGVSRRHAQVTNRRGRYEITDLGSSNGTWVNEQRLEIQATQTLQVGDEVRLGNCRLYFMPVPVLWHAPTPSSQYFFYVTFTGYYFAWPETSTLVIGRADPSLGFKPDIDLGQEGDAASFVSRRHAKITRTGEQFLVEDMGSAYKTRLDGQELHIGLQVPINPGQHLWLGGCVLAFDLVEATLSTT